MITLLQLEKHKEAPICLCDKNTLTDLRGIETDKAKSVPERFDSFMCQVKNPYLFKVGDVAVKIAFSGGRDFSSSLCNALCTS